MKSLYLMLKALLGGSLAKILMGSGIAVVSYAVLLPVVTAALNAIAASIGGVFEELQQVLLLGGLGEVLNIMGSAILTKLALDSGKLGFKKASS